MRRDHLRPASTAGGTAVGLADASHKGGAAVSWPCQPGLCTGWPGRSMLGGGWPAHLLCPAYGSTGAKQPLSWSQVSAQKQGPPGTRPPVPVHPLRPTELGQFR